MIQGGSGPLKVSYIRKEKYRPATTRVKTGKCISFVNA